MSNSLLPHVLLHARLPCSSPTPRVVNTFPNLPLVTSLPYLLHPSPKLPTFSRRTRCSPRMFVQCWLCTYLIASAQDTSSVWWMVNSSNQNQFKYHFGVKTSSLSPFNVVSSSLDVPWFLHSSFHVSYWIMTRLLSTKGLFYRSLVLKDKAVPFLTLYTQ